MKQSKPKVTYLNVPMDKEKKRLTKIAALVRGMSLQDFVTMALEDEMNKVKDLVTINEN